MFGTLGKAGVEAGDALHRSSGIALQRLHQPNMTSAAAVAVGVTVAVAVAACLGALYVP